MHALRLGLQGIEFLATGRITLPDPEPHRTNLRAIRRGDVQLADVLDTITSAETQLTQLREATSVPEQPDRGWVDDWLHRSHLKYWASRR